MQEKKKSQYTRLPHSFYTSVFFSYPMPLLHSLYLRGFFFCNPLPRYSFRECITSTFPTVNILSLVYTRITRIVYTNHFVFPFTYSVYNFIASSGTSCPLNNNTSVSAIHSAPSASAIKLIPDTPLSFMTVFIFAICLTVFP